MVNDETILAAKASFNGKLEGANITLQGEFRGDLKATGLVRILEGSEVNAKVEANAVENRRPLPRQRAHGVVAASRPCPSYGHFSREEIERRGGRPARRRFRDWRRPTRALSGKGNPSDGQDRNKGPRTSVKNEKKEKEGGHKKTRSREAQRQLHRDCLLARRDRFSAQDHWEGRRRLDTQEPAGRVFRFATSFSS